MYFIETNTNAEKSSFITGLKICKIQRKMSIKIFLKTFKCIKKALYVKQTKIYGSIIPKKLPNSRITTYTIETYLVHFKK